jgi:hypothetical protein
MVLWFRECKEGTVVVRAVESTAVMRSLYMNAVVGVRSVWKVL